MSIFVLDKELYFPPVHLAEPDGLLAIGGDLSTQRILLAYRMGIFPWYEGEDILWWCPDPRFVLFPSELKINKTVTRMMKRNEMEFTVDRAFADVIRACKQTARAGQHGTWITDDVERSFTTLHQLGYAHSAEAWKDGRLVGGLYGIRMGPIFFGESMFSRESNASRFAFVNYARQLASEGVELIDCQVFTEYLESLGARMIDGKTFQEFLQRIPK